MDGGDKPPSVARLLQTIPRKVGATATNDAHVTAAENGFDRQDLAAGQKIWIDGALKALRSAHLVNGDDDALIWTGEPDKDYKVKFGTRGKEKPYTYLQRRLTQVQPRCLHAWHSRCRSV